MHVNAVIATAAHAASVACSPPQATATVPSFSSFGKLNTTALCSATDDSADDGAVVEMPRMLSGAWKSLSIPSRERWAADWDDGA